MNNSEKKRQAAAEHNAKNSEKKRQERLTRQSHERQCTRPRWPFIAAGAAFGG